MSSEGCCYDCGKLPLDCDCEDGDEDTWPPRVGDIWRIRPNGNANGEAIWKLTKEIPDPQNRRGVISFIAERLDGGKRFPYVSFSADPDKENLKVSNAKTWTLIDRKEI